MTKFRDIPELKPIIDEVFEQHKNDKYTGGKDGGILEKKLKNLEKVYCNKWVPLYLKYKEDHPDEFE